MKASSTPLPHAGASEIARRIRSGEITARAVTDACLERIARFNPTLNAVVVLRADEARAAADAADRARAAGAPTGPLHGVPMTIKECFDWQGTPSTFGHPSRRDLLATADAAAVERLRAAGAIILGKTNVPIDLSDWQSFNEVYGVTRSPWDLERSPGGSSGGSSAALVAGFSALEIGSDIGGSIRVPAHYCGVYGHKPTFGIVPFRGHAMAHDLPPEDISVIGPLARTAEDLDVAMRVLAGPDGPRARAWRLQLPEPKQSGVRGRHIAVVTNDREFPVDRDTERAANAVATSLREAGARVTLDPALPLPSREYYEMYVALLRATTGSRLSHDAVAGMKARLADFRDDDHGYEALMLRGFTQTHRQWIDRRVQRHRVRMAWEAFFAQYDAVIAPVTPAPAFRHIFDVPRTEQVQMIDDVARPMTDNYYWIGLPAVAYLPATAIPAGQSAGGLPIGLQIIGPEYGDLDTIAIARALEACHRGFEAAPGYP